MLFTGAGAADLLHFRVEHHARERAGVPGLRALENLDFDNPAPRVRPPTAASRDSRPGAAGGGDGRADTPQYLCYHRSERLQDLMLLSATDFQNMSEICPKHVLQKVDYFLT